MARLMLLNPSNNSSTSGRIDRSDDVSRDTPSVVSSPPRPSLVTLTQLGRVDRGQQVPQLSGIGVLRLHRGGDSGNWTSAGRTQQCGHLTGRHPPTAGSRG